MADRWNSSESASEYRKSRWEQRAKSNAPPAKRRWGARQCGSGPFEAYGQVIQEAVHGGEPYLTQSLGRLDVAPHEPVCVFADVGEEGVGGLFYPAPDGVC